MQNLLFRISDKIGKLCELLDDTAETPVVIDKPTSTNPKNLKLLYFQLEQRINDVEKYINDTQIDIIREMEDPKQVDQDYPKPKEEKDKSKIKAKEDVNEHMKNTIMKYEMYINDMSMRISELENGMKKLDPNHLRLIIQDIAELAMKKQKVEINETVDGLRETRMRDIQLIETLKQNLKDMNNRFSSDIDKMVEAKDLKVAKNQLRRRVRFLQQGIVTRIRIKAKRNRNKSRTQFFI